MTHEAKMVITEILLDALEHRICTRGPFYIISDMIDAYHVEWGWVK